MTDAVRWLCIVGLFTQAGVLIVLTFWHSRDRRHEHNFSRWWLHAYGLTAAYAFMAAVIARLLYVHLGHEWTFQLTLIVCATIVGLIATVGSTYLWWRDPLRKEVKDEGR